MRRLGFLLRPGWIALALVVVAFAYLCFSVLAPWQLGKNTTTSRENHQIEASLSADPVAVTSVLPQQDSSAPDAQWRQVTATGRYLPESTILARLRVIDGAPAFEVLTAFAVQGGPTVLVNRGYVRPVEVTKVPQIPPPPQGDVTLTARLRDSETAPTEGKQPFTEGGYRQVYAIDTAQIAGLTGTSLTGSYMQLVADQPGGLGVLALAQVLLAFCMGTGFYLLRRLGGTLLLPMLAHAAWDFSSFTAQLSGAGTPPAKIALMIVTYMLPLLLLAFIALRQARRDAGV